MRIMASSSLDDMAEKLAAKQRKKIAYDKKELDDLTKQMPDPNDDLLVGKFQLLVRQNVVFFSITALLVLEMSAVDCCFLLITQRLVRSSGFYYFHAAKTVTTLEQQLRDTIMSSCFCRFGRAMAVSFSCYDAVVVPLWFF
jgi:hypothetical protein